MAEDYSRKAIILNISRIGPRGAITREAINQGTAIIPGNTIIATPRNKAGMSDFRTFYTKSLFSPVFFFQEYQLLSGQLWLARDNRRPTH